MHAQETDNFAPYDPAGRQDDARDGGENPSPSEGRRSFYIPGHLWGEKAYSSLGGDGNSFSQSARGAGFMSCAVLAEEFRLMSLEARGLTRRAQALREAASFFLAASRLPASMQMSMGLPVLEDDSDA